MKVASLIENKTEGAFLYNYYCFFDEREIIPDGFRISTTDELKGLLLNDNKEFNNSFHLQVTGYLDKSRNHGLVKFGAYRCSNLDGISPKFILFNEERKTKSGGSDDACAYAARCVSKPENDERDFIRG